MNFFGHAVVASRRASSPAVALGAMLPDFESMCQGRIAHIADHDLAAGVALHHQTDAAFHHLPSFVTLYRHATEQLRARGMARGPARGAAHVAVELLLDGALLDDAAACQLYLAALEVATEVVGDQHIRWQEPAHAVRWQHLRLRLRERGLPMAYRDPASVAQRVAFALEHRPLLALDQDDLARMHAALPALGAQVMAGAPALMDELHAALHATPALT